MGLYVHVTSDAIRQLGKDITGAPKTSASGGRDQVDRTTVNTPAFGIIGLPIGWAHHTIQDGYRDFFTAVEKKLDGFAKQLDVIAGNWENVENRNTIKVDGQDKHFTVTYQ